MNDLMIDLETMGNKPNAPIVAIGAVFFNPMTGDLGPQFYTAVNLASELAAGAAPDGDTINWWLKQSSEARAAITSDEAKPIAEALDALTNFVTRSCEQPKYLKVWGNGAAFDNVILREAYERCSKAPCWNWFNDLDVRPRPACRIRPETRSAFRRRTPQCTGRRCTPGTVCFANPPASDPYA